jgi:hypothetical protein
MSQWDALPIVIADLASWRTCVPRLSLIFTFKDGFDININSAFSGTDCTRLRSTL